MMITSTANSRACEICGQLPPDRFARNQAARDTHARYARTRSNRIEVDAAFWVRYPAKMQAAGLPAERWAGKRVCRACYELVIRAINFETEARP